MIKMKKETKGRNREVKKKKIRRDGRDREEEQDFLRGRMKRLRKKIEQNENEKNDELEHRRRIR